MSAGDVVLGVIGGGVGGTALTGAFAYAKGWLDFRGHREDRQERRFNEMFDEARGQARSAEPLQRAEGIFMLRQLAKLTKFSAEQAQIAGELAIFYAEQPLSHAREVQRRGGRFQFRLRVDNDPGQADDGEGRHP